MPSTLLAREEMVESVELALEALLPIVWTSVRSLVASTTSMSVLLPDICVVTDTVLPLQVRLSLLSEISHVPETVFELILEEKLPSLLNVTVMSSVMPHFSIADASFSSIFVAAASPAALERMLSDSNTIAGSLYVHVPVILLSVAWLDEEKMDEMAESTLLDELLVLLSVSLLLDVLLFTLLRMFDSDDCALALTPQLSITPTTAILNTFLFMSDTSIINLCLLQR